MTLSSQEHYLTQSLRYFALQEIIWEDFGETVILLGDCMVYQDHDLIAGTVSCFK